jgi:hypothetical protein
MTTYCLDFIADPCGFYHGKMTLVLYIVFTYRNGRLSTLHLGRDDDVALLERYY